MSKTLSSILHIGAPVSGTGSAILSDSPVITSKIDTSSTSFDLVNTSATTVNIAGAATALALAGTTGTTTIRNNLTVSGNITYGGGANQLSATNLSVDDALIYLAANNSVADIIDIGIVGRYNNGSNDDTHTGLVRDATDKSWKLFSNITAEPTTVVDFTGATYDNLTIGGLTASSGTFTGQITSNIATGTAPFVVTSTTPVSNLNIGGYSSALKSATTIIDVSASMAPSNGKVLTATSATTAEWKDPDYIAPSTVNGITGRVSDTDGNLRSIPQSNKTAAYELTAADNGKNINITTGGITIPSSVFMAGDVVSIYNASDVTQSISWSGPSVYVAGTAGVKTSPLTLAARGILTIMFSTTTDIIASGNV
jgi:hypothetical protein